MHYSYWAAYHQFIEDIYQENALYQNELVLDGDPVDIGNLTMPVLQIIGSFDHLIPPEASKPFTEVIPSEDTDIYEFPTGHVGMAVSGKAHAELWPRVATWFRERSITQTEESATISQGEAEAEADQDQSLQTVDGIGPTYEERLHDAGIMTVTQLAAAESVPLADRLGLSESRVMAWIKQARQFAGSSDESAGSS
ncbi:helix-hairpin-helix domain-containing protein [Haloarcula sp. JP-L23]|uniref:helix-hairpin-helix domain-containing protein n=1 Tax=Haloarcula sp. JP-L23 TaxID=2716717 RepID=UPI001D0395D2